MLSILTQFLSNRSQYAMVGSCRSKLVNVTSRVAQWSVLGPLLFLLYTLELLSILENNKLIGNIVEPTLSAVVPSPGIRVAVAGSLSSDIVLDCEWCDLWGMKMNASKTKTIIVSRTHNASPVTRISY